MVAANGQDNNRPQEPGPFSASYASSLRLTKSRVLQATDDPAVNTVRQFGAVYLDESISLPNPPADLQVNEPLIDMFVCGADGSCQATGSDETLIAYWTPVVKTMATAVYAALAEREVAVAPVAYVTASLTPGDEVVGQAHFDDDQYIPDAGVGVVAIVGSHTGPRIATGAVTVQHPRAGLPLPVDQAVFDEFGEETSSYQQSDSGRIVLFSQFGQLHAGPALSETPDVTYRQLLVFRAETMPD